MWEGVAGLLTLVVMILKLWVSNENAKQGVFDANKKAISDAVARGDVSIINRYIQLLHR